VAGEVEEEEASGAGDHDNYHDRQKLSQYALHKVARDMDHKLLQSTALWSAQV
jgi:hypothetical protein